MSAKGSILIIDDEQEIRETLEQVLKLEGYSPASASTAEEGLKKAEEQLFDLVLLDVSLPDRNGLEVLRNIKRDSPDTGVIMITAYDSGQTAFQASKEGADSYIPKPWDNDRLLLEVRNTLAKSRLQVENIQLRRALKRYALPNIVGKSEPMQKIFDLITQVAPTRATVLIFGESGTGKELVARALHYQSARRRHPFVPVNCAALPEGLLESELFGHAKGAFTGAQIARRGLFLEASRGTLFLDEIGDMPLGMQAKLLRVLEQRQIRPVGSDREVEVDVRVLAATHRDLADAVQQGTFREDLYYRLRVMPVQVPPLRAHREDIPLLAETFVQRHAADNKLEPRRFTREALRCLEQYDWPGNVRQLSHVIERAVTLSNGEGIDVEDLGLEELPQPALRATSPGPGGDPPAPALLPAGHFNVDAMTQHLMRLALEKTRGHKGQAAHLLGVHPRTLTRMMRRFGIPED